MKDFLPIEDQSLMPGIGKIESLLILVTVVKQPEAIRHESQQIILRNWEKDGVKSSFFFNFFFLWFLINLFLFLGNNLKLLEMY